MATSDTAKGSSDDKPTRLLDRELSWLEFNRRVLEEAIDDRNPLLERLRFMTIFGSNLDEFFMKRVGALHRLRVQLDNEPQEQLLKIRRIVESQVQTLSECLTQKLFKALSKEGIELVSWATATADERKFAKAYFQEKIFPVLTPLSVDRGHPFPFISNLSVSFGVLLKHPQKEQDESFARVKVPDIFPTWVALGGNRFLSLYDIVEQHLALLFRGMEITGIAVFRVTRNADIEIDGREQDAEDLLDLVSEGLRERRFARAVRLEHGPTSDKRVLKVIEDALDTTPMEMYSLPLPLEFYDLQPIIDLPRPELKFHPWLPVVPDALQDPDHSIFDVIKQNDLLVHHPYDSFTTSVERFIRTAADDPKVLAIKMTLYRTSEDSPFVPLLIRAAERGKQVACLVELQARFDEERNILVARTLEKAGVHVVYGVLGLKTHCKLSLVIRNEKDGVHGYAHLGTGNYHPHTAQLYTDLGLFTCKTKITNEVVHLFHFLTGRAVALDHEHLLVAPVTMRTRFLELIENEIHHAAEGGGHIIAQMNGLDDPGMIEALYRASNAGVIIELVVRGICSLRPGVPGMSENIRVTSVVGRFLEHCRMIYFRNASKDPMEGKFFIGSADWMSRNLNKRVETYVPIEDVALKRKLWDILGLTRNDTRQSWELTPEGKYRRVSSAGGETTTTGSHAMLMDQSTKRQKKSRK